MTRPPTPIVCPRCGEGISLFVDPEAGVVPRPGDFTFCPGCSSLIRFRDDLTPRAATPSECFEVHLREPDLELKLMLSRAVNLPAIDLEIAVPHGPAEEPP
jgi:hypothetical protein